MEAKKRLLMGSHLPAGFRFHPTDQELISSYLSKKVACSLPQEWDIIAQIDLYKLNPWELPEKAFFGEEEWFFFTPRERKYPNGVRPNRAAASGFWKATGTDKPILDTSGTQCIGVKKALVFYKGRPPKGIKTEWVMHEYRLLDSIAPASHSKKQKAPSMRLDDWVLCRVRQKSNSPAASDEAAETSSPPQSGLTLSTQTSERQKAVVERSSCLNDQWNDNQLLGCFMDSYDQQRGGNAWEVSDPADFMRYAQLGCGAGYIETQQVCPQLMPELLGSMKRKISYGMLDELILMPAGKRLQYSSADDLLSPTESDSVNQGFFPDQFFISQY